MKCWKCGNVLGSSDLFCPRCGVELHAPLSLSPEISRHAEIRRSSGWRITGAILALLGAATVGSLILSSFASFLSDKSPSPKDIKIDEQLACAELKQIAASCELYKEERGFYPANLSDMVVAEPTPRQQRHGIETPAWSVMKSTISGVDSGYAYRYHRSGNSRRQSFYIVAVPRHYGVTGKESFYIDQTGNVGFTCDNRAATDNDPFFLEGISHVCQ